MINLRTFDIFCQFTLPMAHIFFAHVFFEAQHIRTFYLGAHISHMVTFQLMIPTYLCASSRIARRKMVCSMDSNRRPFKRPYTSCLYQQVVFIYKYTCKYIYWRLLHYNSQLSTSGINNASKILLSCLAISLALMYFYKPLLCVIKTTEIPDGPAMWTIKPLGVHIQIGISDTWLLGWTFCQLFSVWKNVLRSFLLIDTALVYCILSYASTLIIWTRAM